MGTFDFNTRELQKLVGTGDLVGKVTVDQVYARAQHEGDWVTGPLAGHRIRRHPWGGGGNYLRGPLFEQYPEYLQGIADTVLDEEGDGPQDGMKEAVQKLAAQVLHRAPVWLDNLRRSAAAEVTDNEQQVFYLPPGQKRLSAEELAAMARGRRWPD